MSVSLKNEGKSSFLIIQLSPEFDFGYATPKPSIRDYPSMVLVIWMTHESRMVLVIWMTHDGGVHMSAYFFISLLFLSYFPSLSSLPAIGAPRRCCRPRRWSTVLHTRPRRHSSGNLHASLTASATLSSPQRPIPIPSPLSSSSSSSGGAEQTAGVVPAIPTPPSSILPAKSLNLSSTSAEHPRARPTSSSAGISSPTAVHHCWPLEAPSRVSTSIFWPSSA